MAEFEAGTVVFDFEARMDKLRRAQAQYAQIANKFSSNTNRVAQQTGKLRNDFNKIRLENVRKQFRLLNNEIRKTPGASSKFSSTLGGMSRSMRSLENKFENSTKDARAFNDQIQRTERTLKRAQSSLRISNPIQRPRGGSLFDQGAIGAGRSNAGAASSGLTSTTSSMDDFTESAQRGSKVSNKFSNALSNVGSSAVLTFGPLSGVGSRIIALSAIAKRGTIEMSAFLGVLTGFAVLSVQALRNGLQFEKQMGQLEAQIKATGDSMGITADQINDFARQLGEATLTSARAVRQQASQVLGFGNILGEDIKRVLTASQDVSAASGRGLSTIVRQLSTALSDPAEGLSRLRRVGVTFTDQQEDLIEALAKSGRLFEAQEKILKAVEAQYSGFAQGAATGLAGAVDTLGERWAAFTEKMAQEGALSAATKNINAISTAIINAEGAIGPLGVALKGTIQGATSILRGFAENLDKIAKAALAFASVRIAQKLIRITAAAGEAGAALFGVQVALAPWITLAAVIAGAAASIVYFGDTWDRVLTNISNNSRINSLKRQIEDLEDRLQRSGGKGAPVKRKGQFSEQSSRISSKNEDNVESKLKSLRDELKNLQGSTRSFGDIMGDISNNILDGIASKVNDISKTVFDMDFGNMSKGVEETNDGLDETLGRVNELSVEMRKLNINAKQMAGTFEGAFREAFPDFDRMQSFRGTGEALKNIRNILDSGTLPERAALKRKLEDLGLPTAREDILEISNLIELRLDPALENARNAGEAFSDALTSGLEEIFIKGESVLGVLKNIGREILVGGLKNLFLKPLSSGFADVGTRFFSNFDPFGGTSATFNNLGGVSGGFGALQGAGPGRASGGPVTTGQSYVVGENGPETFIPSRSGRIDPNGGSQGVNITINAPGADEGTINRIREIAQVEFIPQAVNGSLAAFDQKISRPRFS